MFVHRYPKWVARIVFRDGATFFYDGAKDMFKHLFDVGRYTPGRERDEIVAVHVTDYYDVELVEARAAFYVIGSDVLGPMGHELLPFREEDAAKEFKDDHRGKQILRFADVTPATIETLDRVR
jgi:nitrous oxide reductase accessory protein NosL